jgi:hypothetical protein
MELAAQIAELTVNLAGLPDSKLGFATSLISQFARKRSLSPKQTPYVAELLAIAKGEKKQPERVKMDVGSFAGVIALFKTAGGKLKYPKITLKLGEQIVILSVAGAQAKAPGTVNLNSEGSWGNRSWYGRVSPDGVFERSNQLSDEFAAVLVPILQELATDTAAAVQRYGKMSGSCMFCNTKLGSPDGTPNTPTSARSVAAGFGETCAKNWGLHEEWKTAAARMEVKAAA